MGVNGEALQLHAVYKKPYFFTARHVRIRSSTISHVRICASTTSHARIHIRYCRSHALCLNVQWSKSNWFVEWYYYHHSTKLYRNNVTQGRSHQIWSGQVCSAVLEMAFSLLNALLVWKHTCHKAIVVCTVAVKDTPIYNATGQATWKAYM